MVGAYGQCENGESNKNNLQISTELKNLISTTQILFTLESVCMHESDGWGSEVKWDDRHA